MKYLRGYLTAQWKMLQILGAIYLLSSVFLGPSPNLAYYLLFVSFVASLIGGPAMIELQGE